MAEDREGSSTGVSQSTQTVPTADRPEQELDPGEKSQQPGVQPDQSQPSLKTEGKTTLSHVSQSTQTVPTAGRPGQELYPGEKSQQPGVQPDQSQPSLKTEGKTTLSHVSQSTQTVPTADRPEQELDPGEKSQQPGVQPDQSQPSLKTEGKTTLSHASQSTQTVPTADRPEQELDPGEKSQQSGVQPDQTQPSLKTVEETLTDEDVPFTWTDLRQVLHECSVFCVVTTYIDQCLKKGQSFTERHERMLREIVYTDMSDDELVKVLQWMHLHRHDCKSLEKIVLQMLYHKRHSVSREFVDWSRYIIVVGGWWNTQPSDNTSVIAARTTLEGQLGSFKTLTNPPGIPDDGLYGGRCVWHPDLGVMFYCGGWAIDGDPVKRCWMYNPATGKWGNLQPMSEGRIDFTLHVLPSSRYIMAVGGWGGGSLLSGCEQFDLVTQTWRPVCSLPGARCDHAGVVCDDVLYVTGGNVGGDSPTTATVLVYDEVTDTCQDAPPMLNRRAAHSAGTIPGSVVVCGGADFSSNITDVLSVEKFDTATRQWTIISHLRLGHSCTQGVCIDHRLFVIGGDCYQSRDVRGNTRDVTVVDMTDGQVTLEPDKLPSAVSGPAVCVIRLPESVIDN